MQFTPEEPAGLSYLSRTDFAAEPGHFLLEAGIMRAILYWLAKLLGDLNAAKRGKVGRRVGRRMAGKITGRGMRKLFR